MHWCDSEFGWLGGAPGSELFGSDIKRQTMCFLNQWHPSSEVSIKKSLMISFWVKCLWELFSVLISSNHIKLHDCIVQPTGILWLSLLIHTLRGCPSAHCNLLHLLEMLKLSLIEQIWYICCWLLWDTMWTSSSRYNNWGAVLQRD